MGKFITVQDLTNALKNSNYWLQMTVKNNERQTQDSLISANENRRMFDHIASYYDKTNTALTLGLDAYWRSVAVERLSPKSKETYLDVGCGTGDMAIKIVRKAPGAKVIGIDPSEGMLRQGKEKIISKSLEESIDLQIGNALELSFEDNSFHGAITAFCIRNVTNRKKALEEIHRTLTEGSKLVILELTQPQGILMKPLFGLYSEIVMPLVTKLMSSASAYKYLTDSMAAFPAPQEIMSLLEECGFVNIIHKRLTGGIVTLFVGEKP